MTTTASGRIRKRWAILIAIILAVMLITALVLWQNNRNAPRDLGPKLQYIGGFDYGCVIIFLCDSTPGTNYYFATDMTVTELATYFKHAKCEPPGAIDWSMGCYYNDHRHLLFSVRYYHDSPMDLKYYDGTIVQLFNKTNKPLIVEINKDDYRKAVRAL